MALYCGSYGSVTMFFVYNIKFQTLKNDFILMLIIFVGTCKFQISLTLLFIIAIRFRLAVHYRYKYTLPLPQG